MVLVEKQHSDRASPSTQQRRRGVGEGRGCALDQVFSPPLAPLFIGEGARGAGPSRWDLEGGGGQGGGTCPPSKGGAPSRVPPPTLGAWAQGGGRPALQGLVPCPLRIMWPSERGGPSRWTPGTPPVAPVQYRYAPETFPMAETRLPIYNSLPLDHSGTPRDVRDLIRDSEQLSVITYKSS